MKSNYYVYLYRCPKTNRVRYVGKGKNRRAYNFKQHHAHCGNWLKTLTCDPIVEFIHTDLTHDEALLLEEIWICQYKAILEPLTNLTLGGKGSAGFKHTEESKKKVGLASKGRIPSVETRQKMSTNRTGEKNPRFGKVCSEETKRKISLMRAGKVSYIPTEQQKEISRQLKVKVSKSIIHVETGTVYLSIKAAARAISTSPSNIREHLKGNLRTIKGCTFKWL